MLGQARFLQGTAHEELPGGAVAGPVVKPVVGIRPVQHGAEAPCIGQAPQVAKEGQLAIVAAVGRIGDELGAIELVGPDHLVPKAQPRGDVPSFRQLPFGIGRGNGGHGHAAVPQDFMRHRRQEGAVDPAGKGDNRPGQLGQPCFERGQFVQDYPPP